MFGTLKPKAGGSGGFGRSKSVKASMFGHLYEKAMELTIKTQYGRGPEFRPSSFPVCSIKALMRLSEGLSLGYFPSEMEASGGYFTSVGTAAHENIQYYIGEMGNIWGNWKCKNPNCIKCKRGRDLIDADGVVYRKGKLTRKETVNNRCPKCDHPMEYIEIEINVDGVKGHIDCIVKLKSGGWWVADYKTSTKYQISNATKLLPHREHLLQIPTYCYCLEKQYGMDIHGFSILYLSRDNPFLFYEYADMWTDTWRAKMKKAINAQRKRFKAAVISLIERSPDVAIAFKPCANLSEYEKTMEGYTPCPYLEICFKPGLAKELKRRLREFPYTDKQLGVMIARFPSQVLPSE